MFVVDQFNFGLFVFAFSLLSFLNGYKHALNKASKKLKYNQKAQEYNYSNILNQQAKYNLTFLFYSIFSLGLYATTITKFIQDNMNFYTEILSTYTDNKLFWVFILIFISTLIAFLFAWLLPRIIFGLAPSRFCQIFYPIAKLLHKIAYPVAKQLFNFSKNFVKVMFNEKQGFNKYILQNSQLSSAELRTLLDPSEEKNRVLLNNAYDFQNTKTRNVTIPRNEVKYIDIKDSIQDVQKMFLRTKLSKLIVVNDTIDKVEGYVHYLDMYSNPSSINNILKEISVIPEGMPLPQLMDKLKSENQSVAWVIDEFGGTSGIVTMEDVMEEIFGNIKDEHDVDIEYLDKRVKKGEYLFSGRLDLSDLEEKYNLEFPDAGDVETLSGYLIQHLNEIPKNGDKIRIENSEYTILSVKDKKIESVQLKLKED